jgi:hypothetical protein
MRAVPETVANHENLFPPLDLSTEKLRLKRKII